MNFSVTGELNKGIILLAGPLFPGIADFTSISPLIGSLDIGSNPLVGGVPGSLTVLADGTGTFLPPTLFNLIWNTGADGDFALSVALPPGIPSGFEVPMQAVVQRTGGSSISNCVVLKIQ